MLIQKKKYCRTRVAAAVNKEGIRAMKSEIKKILKEMVFLEQVLNRVDCRPKSFADPLFKDYNLKDIESVEDRLLQFISTTAQGIHFRLRYLKVGKSMNENLLDR